MGNQGSFMEKVYVYLPVLMCHSKMDYGDKATMWNIRAAYFAEQASGRGRTSASSSIESIRTEWCAGTPWKLASLPPTWSD